MDTVVDKEAVARVVSLSDNLDDFLRHGGADYTWAWIELKLPHARHFSTNKIEARIFGKTCVAFVREQIGNLRILRAWLFFEILRHECRHKHLARLLASPAPGQLLWSILKSFEEWLKRNAVRDNARLHSLLNRCVIVFDCVLIREVWTEVSEGEPIKSRGADCVKSCRASLGLSHLRVQPSHTGPSFEALNHDWDSSLSFRSRFEDWLNGWGAFEKLDFYKWIHLAKFTFHNFSSLQCKKLELWIGGLLFCQCRQH